MLVKKMLAAAGAVCIFSHVASAEWERTISTWDSRLTDQGEVQVALWGWYEPADHADYVSGRLYLNYGLANNWNFSVAPGYAYMDIDGVGSDSGITDTGLSSTYRFMDEATAGFDLALMGGVSLPTGDEDDGFGSDKVEPELTLIAAKTLGAVVVVGNVGGSYVVDANEGTEDFQLYGAAEGILPVTDQLSINTVLTAATSRVEDGDEMVDIGLGIRFTPSECMFIVASGFVCLTDAYDEAYQLAAGFKF
ncbi:MAG TPA: hypothetical protein DCS43_01495 [Verrucomicrobia bacterium]|nr:hypothetical protein [Verrucomicrobiota bacterium]